MSSGQAKYAEMQADKQWMYKKRRIAIVAHHIAKIDPDTQEGRDFEWVINNKDKILRNKRLIELIG